MSPRWSVPTKAPPTRLDEAWSDAWQRLSRGVKDRKHAFRTPTVSTTHPETGPASRVVVLRGVDPVDARLAFHTDARSRKIAELEADPRVAWCFYDAKARVQLRATGVATVLADDLAQEAWDRASVFCRRTYACEPGPGTPVPDGVSGLEHLPHSDDLVAADVAAAQAVFRRVWVRLARLERLDLAVGGHRRMVWTRPDGAWAGEWLVP